MESAVELRVELAEDHPFFAVSDALCAADPNESRASITRRVLQQWAEKELHRASLVMRVAGRHAEAMESGRKRPG